MYSLKGMGADIFNIPVPDINAPFVMGGVSVPSQSSVDTAALMATPGVPFSYAKLAASLPGYSWFDPIYSWLQNNQGVVWIGAAAAVGLMALGRRRR